MVIVSTGNSVKSQWCSSTSNCSIISATPPAIEDSYFGKQVTNVPLSVNCIHVITSSGALQLAVHHCSLILCTARKLHRFVDLEINNTFLCTILLFVFPSGDDIVSPEFSIIHT